MIKKIYGMMDAQEKEDHAKLIAHEINAYLRRIYKELKPKKNLKPQKVKASNIIMKHASLGATKMWEFRPNPRARAAAGDVGQIIIVTRGLESEAVRKQRALLIAAEFYVYHSFANASDPKLYARIRNQNQYLDILKKLFGIHPSHDIRDKAIRYVVEHIGEHKIAHYSGEGWTTSIARLEKHYPDIASAVGSSEKVFKEIFRKQHQKLGAEMLKQEEDLVRKEIDDIDHLLEVLEGHKKKNHGPKFKKLIKIHEDNLRTLRVALAQVAKNIDSWVLVDKEEHKELAKKVITMREIHKLVQEEAEAEEIDINKIHIIFKYFKKEKINILRDIELLDRLSARHNPKKQ